MRLQPVKSSFENYIKLGYEYTTKKKFDKKAEKYLKKVSLIDNALLIVDDFLDQSKIRNGKPCLYLEKGVNDALIVAEEKKIQALKSLNLLMDHVHTKSSYKNKVNETLLDFLGDIYKGEKINLELTKVILTHKEKLRKYKTMIKLFTGGHIKYGLAIGQLIANKKADKNVNKIAELAGMVRQIVDDYKDYFEGHHEAFGDFLCEDNRLPEILFYEFGGVRSKVVRLLKLKKYEEARNLVLNKDVRNQLYKECKTLHNRIEKITSSFPKEVLVEDYSVILN